MIRQEPYSNPHRLMLVDDHPIVRQGMTMLLNQEPDLTVCSEVSQASDALDLVPIVAPDAIVVDLSLLGTSGLELTKCLREKFPDIPTLILSMHDEQLYAERALRAGARGYVMKHAPAETVLKAIRTILAGDIYISPALAAKGVRERQENGSAIDSEIFGIDRLSDRELEVFELIGRGYTTRNIAEALELSVKTIETHRAHIKQKLKLKNATELVHRAYHWMDSVGNT